MKAQFEAVVVEKLERMGMPTVHARNAASKNSDSLHVFPDGTVASCVDGQVYSGTRALDVLATRIYSGASTAERGSTMTPEQRAEARARKIAAGEYSI